MPYYDGKEMTLEEITRDVLSDSRKWPQHYLAMKQPKVKDAIGYPRCGVVLAVDDDGSVVVQNHPINFGEDFKLEYANVDALLIDGWVVD
jgi:hypothetical protein